MNFQIVFHRKEIKKKKIVLCSVHVRIVEKWNCMRKIDGETDGTICCYAVFRLPNCKSFCSILVFRFLNIQTLLYCFRESKHCAQYVLYIHIQYTHSAHVLFSTLKIENRRKKKLFAMCNII